VVVGDLVDLAVDGDRGLLLQIFAQAGIARVQRADDVEQCDRLPEPRWRRQSLV